LRHISLNLKRYVESFCMLGRAKRTGRFEQTN
jgi:hypothetical protein